MRKVIRRLLCAEKVSDATANKTQIKMWIAILLLVAIVLLFFYLDAIKPKNYPPGPKWFPILGCALELSALRKKTGLLAFAAADLAGKYGPLIGLKIGQERIVVCYGSAAIKDFLSNESLNGRPTGSFYQLRTFGRKGILLTDETFWSEQRRFILRHLREFGFGKRNMSELIQQEAEVMINHIKDGMGKNNEIILQMDNMFGIHVLNTIWTMLAGTKYNPDDKDLKHLQCILNTLFKNIDMIGAIFSQFPVLRYLAPEFSGYNLYMKSHRPIWDFIKKEIANHKKSHQPQEPRDLIDVYLEILNSPDKPDSFSEDQLLAICLDLFMAGSETTTKSLAFCFLHLLLNQDVQKKAQEEIDRVVGKERLPTLNDRPNMPYTEAVVLEALRLFMSRTFGVPHRALKDTTISGYNIPKDTMVITSFYGIFTDKNLWNDSDAFRPERFMDEGSVKTFENFIPFGLGKRRCLGETLARANLFIFVAGMLQNFTFEIPEGHKLSTVIVDGVTAGTAPFQGLIKIRT